MTICVTPAMILCEDMKTIEHVLLNPICVLPHLMRACKHCNLKLLLFDTSKFLMNISLEKTQI